MQTPLTGVADVHSGPLAHRFESLKDLNIVGAVIALGDFFFGHILHSRGWKDSL
jgi:hypothetical protein